GIYDQYGNLTHSTATVSLVISGATPPALFGRSEEHTSDLQSRSDLVCRHKPGKNTLDATSGVLLGDTSTSFTISPAADPHLTFDVQPPHAATLFPYTTLFRSGIYDQYGNLTHSTATVSLVISGATPPALFG